jgi:hypothetical protein
MDPPGSIVAEMASRENSGLVEEAVEEDDVASAVRGRTHFSVETLFCAACLLLWHVPAAYHAGV